jgi:hypothetical protein
MAQVPLQQAITSVQEEVIDLCSSSSRESWLLDDDATSQTGDSLWPLVLHGGFDSNGNWALSNLSDESNTSSEEEERISTSEAEFESLSDDSWYICCS